MAIHYLVIEVCDPRNVLLCDIMLTQTETATS